MSGVGSTPPVPPPPSGGQAAPAPASTPAASAPPAPSPQAPPTQAPAPPPSGGGQSGSASQQPPPSSSGAAAQISASLSELAKGGQFSAQVVARDGQALLVRTAAGTTLALNNLATLLAQANTAVLNAALKLQLNPANPQQATVVSANGVTLQPPLTVQAQPPTTAQMQLAISPPQPNAGAAVLPTAGQSLGAVVVPQPLLSGGGAQAAAVVQPSAAVLPPGSQLQLVVQSVTPPATGAGPAVSTAGLPGSAPAPGAPPVVTSQPAGAAPVPQIPTPPGVQPGIQTAAQAGVQATPAAAPLPGAVPTTAVPVASVPLPGAAPAASLPGSPPMPSGPAAPPVAPAVTAVQPAAQPLPSSSAALTTSSLPQTIAGVVTGQNQAGQVLLNTPQGLLALNLPQPLPPGTQLSLELTALVRPSSPAATTLGPQPLAGVLARLQGQWPALQQTLDALRAADPALAQRVQNDLLPQPNGRLASTSLQFMAAAAVGSAQAWLGSEAVRRLEQQGRGDLLRALDDDFRDIGRLNQRQGDTNWQALVMPMLIGGRVEPIHIFMRRRRDPKRKQDQTRFIIDFNLESTGPIQFDGLVSVKHLDLILRSESAFGPAFRMDVIAIFEEAQAVTGMTGSIRFLDHEAPLPWPSPELELRGSTTELKV